MLAGIYLTLLLLTSLPTFQRWGADYASRLLADKAGCKVSIGALKMSLLGRANLDNVKLYDQRDTLMLQVPRIAASIDLLPLVEKKIRISGAQLIGAKARLYKDGEAAPNFQFLVDAFSSKDTTTTPLDLAIRALVVRRGEVRFDRLDKSETPGKFNPNHLHVKDLSLTARIFVQKPDSFAVDLRGLSLREQSGLRLNRLSFEAKVGKKSATIEDFLLELPNTAIKLTMEASGQGQPSTKKGLLERFTSLTGKLEGDLCPHDLTCFVPQLNSFDNIIEISSGVRCTTTDNGLPPAPERSEVPPAPDQREEQTTDNRLSPAPDLREERTRVNYQLKTEGLSIRDKAGNISLLCDATISDLRDTPTVFANIAELRTGPSLQQFLTQNLKGQAQEISPILTHLGSTKTSGTIAYQNKSLRTNLQTESEQGIVSVNGTLHEMREVEAIVAAKNLKLGNLLNLSGEGKGTALSFETNILGTLPGKDRQTKLVATGLINSLVHKGYEHRNIHFNTNIDGDSFGGGLLMDAPHGQTQVQLQTAMQQGKRTLLCNAQVKDFAPYQMNLTKRYEDERFSGNIEAEFSDIDLNNLQGNLRLTDLVLASEKEGTLRIGDVLLSSNVTEHVQHLLVKSDFLNVKADGNFNWKNLPASFMQPIRQNLPSLFKTDSRQASGNDFAFQVQVQDTVLFERLLDTDLHLPERSTLEGTVSDAIGHIFLQMHIPQLQMGAQELQNLECRAETSRSSFQTSLQCERMIKGKPVELNLDAYATGDKVTSRLRWDNKRSVSHTGDISLTGIIRRDLSDSPTIDAKMNDSHIVIGDTLWQIKPASIRYHDKMIDVTDLSISQAQRHINIGGRISELASDTLKAELADIDISYIMDLVNFHKVDFDGRTTGSIYATSLMKKPLADAFLQVKDFTFNAAQMGDMDLYANWGKQERAIILEADMKGPMPQHRTQVSGTIIPGKGKEDGLNLYIKTSNIDLSFLSKYTKGIFSNLQGRASGWTRVYGPFKLVNLEGDMFVEEMKMHVLALGTDYHLAGDSVTLRPDNIWLRGGHVYDYIGIPGMTEHMATIDAHLMHSALKNLRFDINIDAHNLLGYNFPHQGSMNFYGVAYADAQVHMSGKPGTVNIDVSATPMPGTTIMYNVATPGTVTETEFVTYGPLTASDGEDTATATLETDGETPESGTADIHLNFDIDANPDAQIRLLMDPRAGDNITLCGNGRLHANYYNKGRFQLFGTYRISEGNYRMSIRDLIRKDFTFQPDGTIIFGGDAMKAALNLKATHTVPNVSLDDLGTNGLGLSNTRVDCIMNIGGIARDPVITFDFDIPNANEDEKQMIRSMLNTEEERDMQAIYLLGVGRFYSYGSLLDTRQTKGGMAMNSVLSSALSSRFNQIMSQALGGSSWSFGTNLRTGEEGWEHLDVEGMLSGKMLSGRLIFNGNFGYRENKYKMGSNNFIGDFDIQYRLSPRSPFSLKAYNQTNDRYFTQSSLTTQGIGIKFQRDFNRFLELFHRSKKK